MPPQREWIQQQIVFSQQQHQVSTPTIYSVLKVSKEFLNYFLLKKVLDIQNTGFNLRYSTLITIHLLSKHL
jgi:hypothetical protein